MMTYKHTNADTYVRRHIITYLMCTEPEQVWQKLFPQALIQFSGAQILTQNKLLKWEKNPDLWSKWIDGEEWHVMSTKTRRKPCCRYEKRAVVILARTRCTLKPWFAWFTHLGLTAYHIISNHHHVASVYSPSPLWAFFEMSCSGPKDPSPENEIDMDKCKD